MKKNINNKVYDTEKAKFISGSVGKSEELYRKRTGEYFIYFRNTGIKKKIKPVTYKEAAAWAESNMSPEVFNTSFGSYNSDDTKYVTVIVQLKSSLAKKLKTEAEKSEMSLKAFIEKLIEEY